MGGFFGAVSRKNCKYDVFFGTDYHSHLGTRRGGMAFYDHGRGFQRQIHGIENTPFRTKFENDLMKFSGTSGIGCISDTDPQPLLVRSHLGLFTIATVGLTAGATGKLSVAAQCLIIIYVYFGRAGVLTISLGFLMGDKAEERFRYAKTSLLIG